MGSSVSKRAPTDEAGEDGAGVGPQRYPVVGLSDIMRKKAHGTSERPAQQELRWACSHEIADRIGNFNRHNAEYRGYWESTSFLADVDRSTGSVETFYDCVTGAPLFRAPIGRSWAAFIRESKSHGWPSFRDEEVLWDNVRCLRNGECVSTTGTHLGHNSKRDLERSAGSEGFITNPPLSPIDSPRPPRQPLLHQPCGRCRAPGQQHRGALREAGAGRPRRAARSVARHELRGGVRASPWARRVRTGRPARQGNVRDFVLASSFEAVALVHLPPSTLLRAARGACHCITSS